VPPDGRGRRARLTPNTKQVYRLRPVDLNHLNSRQISWRTRSRSSALAPSVLRFENAMAASRGHMQLKLGTPELLSDSWRQKW
jgi:hypothetical protein